MNRTVRQAGVSNPRHEPHWVAAAAAVAALYGIWPGLSMVRDIAGKHGQGYAWFPFLIVAPIAFAVVLIALTPLLIWLLGRLPNHTARAAACLLLAAIFWARNGIPNLFCLGLVGFIAVSAYVDATRRRTDAQDRDTFFHD